MHPRQQYIKDVYGKEPETLDEIGEACVKVIQMSTPIIGFAWRVVSGDTISNSHNCPLSGYQNWSGRNDAPRTLQGYPGFIGRVWARIDPASVFSSSDFKKTLTHTGTGGFGAYDGLWHLISSAVYQSKGLENFNYRREISCFSYDYRFYLDDFPAYKETFEALKAEWTKEYMWDKLKMRRISSKFVTSHAFKWEDPETKQEDQHFIEAWKLATLPNK